MSTLSKMKPKSTPENTLIAIPAFNEEESIVPLLKELAQFMPGYPVAVVSDGSSDRTAELAAAAGAVVIDLPCNLGVGGAVQSALQYAWRHEYQYVVRIDSDGQHPPQEIHKLVACMEEHEDCDLVIGSRYCGERSYRSSRGRMLGIKGLSALLSWSCQKTIFDPTSGFHMFSREMIICFAHSYPVDYPEPEALAFMRRHGYSFEEVSALFRERQAGSSTIDDLGTIYYLIKVFIALLIDRLRPADVALSREKIAGTYS